MAPLRGCIPPPGMPPLCGIPTKERANVLPTPPLIAGHAVAGTAQRAQLLYACNTSRHLCAPVLSWHVCCCCCCCYACCHTAVVDSTAAAIARLHCRHMHLRQLRMLAAQQPPQQQPPQQPPQQQAPTPPAAPVGMPPAGKAQHTAAQRIVHHARASWRRGCQQRCAAVNLARLQGWRGCSVPLRLPPTACSKGGTEVGSLAHAPPRRRCMRLPAACARLPTALLLVVGGCQRGRVRTHPQQWWGDRLVTMAILPLQH
jgi:hypothetical protein